MMALVFHRGVAIPLWAVAFCAVALATPPPSLPSVAVLVGIAAAASTMMAMVWWWQVMLPRMPELDAALDRRLP